MGCVEGVREESPGRAGKTRYIAYMVNGSTRMKREGGYER